MTFSACHLLYVMLLSKRTFTECQNYLFKNKKEVEKRSKYNTALTSEQSICCKSAFTVVMTGDNPDGQCNVSAWKEIIWMCVESVNKGLQR